MSSNMATNLSSDISRASSFESVMSSLKQVRHASSSLRPSRTVRSTSSSRRLEAIGEHNVNLPATRFTPHAHRQRPSFGQRQFRSGTNGRVGAETGTLHARQPASSVASSLEDSAKRFHADCAKYLVLAVVESVASLEQILRDVGSSHQASVLSGSRVAHVQKILSIDSKRLSGVATGLDRIQFICACLSLANDLELYRQRRARKEGNSPKAGTIPTNSILRASDDALRDSFVLTQAPIDNQEKSILLSAVGFGTKLRVVDAIGKSLGLGSGFTLLCGYQYFNLNELPSRAFSSLRVELQQSWAACNGIKNFSRSIDEWWQSFYLAYEEQLSSVKPPSKGLSPRSAAAHPLIAQHSSKPAISPTSGDTSSAVAQASPSVVERPILEQPLTEEPPALASSPKDTAVTDTGTKFPGRSSQVNNQKQQRRRSRSLGELSPKSSTGLRQRSTSAQAPTIPRRSSKRPSIEQLVGSQPALRQGARRPRESLRSQSGERGERLEKAQPTTSLSRRPTGLRSRALTSSDMPPPVPEKDVNYVPDSRSPSRSPARQASTKECTERPRLLASKYHRPSEGPLTSSIYAEKLQPESATSATASPSSVEVHLDDLLQGLEEEIAAERSAWSPSPENKIQQTPVATIMVAS